MYKIIGADGRIYGPVTPEQLRQWITEGRVNAQTQIQAEDCPDWKLLTQFPEIISTASKGEPQPINIPSPAEQKTSGFAIAGMVLGILAIVTCYFGIIFGILGLIFSAIANSRINKNPATLAGKGMAVAGLVMSIVALALDTVWLIIFWAAIMTVMGSAAAASHFR